MISPIKLAPVFKEIIWGGNRLKNEYNKQSELENIAESWELTVRDDGMNKIVGGEFDGYTLAEYIEKNGYEVVSNKKLDRFPLLIKFIDAEDNLSVQVHPDDEYGLKNANSLGKTEMWYIIDAKPGSKLVYGLKEGVTNEMFAQAINDGKVEEMLNYVPVKKGDVFFIPSGLVHAIGAGILLAEIQQNSNITYRVYDYNRVGKDGKPRELHINDALNVIVNRNEQEIDAIRYSNDEKLVDSNLANCQYFKVDRYKTSSAMFLVASKESFNSVLCLEGEGTIFCDNKEYALNKGDSYFIPAGMGGYVIRGNVEVIVSKIN
ncbi:MAG: class I mannose-6-phosphate isomerase [Clostridia bacterium]|nr:class I mannose-6-phosphate isomerase [Clostridia bacterium]